MKTQGWIPYSKRFVKPPLGTPEGDRDSWVNGVLFSDWISGNHGPMTNCISLTNWNVADTDREQGRCGVGRAALSPVRDRCMEDGRVEWDEGARGFISDLDREDGFVEWTTGVSGVLADLDREDGSTGRSEGETGILSDDDREDGSTEYDQGAHSEIEDLDREDGSTEASGGGVTPGSDCASAAAITLPYHASYTHTALSDDWFKFTVANGTTYHVTISAVSGGGLISCTLSNGTCPFPTQLEIEFSAGCIAHTASADETWFIRLAINSTPATDYTIDIDAGGC